MPRDRILTEDCREVASSLGVDPGDVDRVVRSFFDAISDGARKLPFDNRRRIYSRDAFDMSTKVVNIPCVGRIGTSYSRYLAWRRNESSGVAQARRDSFRARIPQGEIERIAGEILSGRVPEPVRRRRKSELYDTVWLVGKDGKRLARQVITKGVSKDDDI